MTSTITLYVNEHTDELYALHKELCLIPAPSHLEHRRAEFCKAWFDENLGGGAYIDEALNVIYPYKADGNELTVFCAHTDTVFPDTEYPMPFSDDGTYIRSPGVGDDTASLAAMMIAAKYVVKNNVDTKGGVLFVANSCEEGLGNLKGTRQLMKDYDGRIKQFISFDSKIPHITVGSVGSHRYNVEVTTEGGHSWGAFGKKNAIAELARIAAAIYDIELPVKEGAKVTYNVGTISGGTSVNTIAQSAQMLCEYRSNDRELLAFMEERFHEIFKAVNKDDVKVTVTKVGDRPCMGFIPDGKQEALIALATDVVERVYKTEVNYGKGSTDCNIPLSIGIPAIAVGNYKGGGTHTREEWVEKASMIPGLEFTIELMIALMK